MPSPWERFQGKLDPDVIAYLEDRDRQLETYLDQLSGNAVSVTAVTQAIWHPSMHADTHASTGSDPVSPGSIGADTPALRDAAIAAARTVVEDEGTPLTQRTNVNFTGAGVTAADAGGKTVVTIPATATTDGHIIQDEAVDVTPQRARLAFRGAGVAAADTGSRTAVDIPGKPVEDEGVAVTYRDTLNFVGTGVTVTDAASKTQVSVPGGPTAATPTHVSHRGEAVGTGTLFARDDHRHQRGKVPLLRKSSTLNQTLATGTATNLVFQTTDHNLVEAGDTAFDVVSTSLFSPPEDGLYLVTAQIEFAAGTDSTRRIVTLFNNTDATTLVQISAVSIPTGGQSTLVLMAEVWPLLAAKDYAIRARQDKAASNLDVVAGSTFQALWVGPSA